LYEVDIAEILSDVPKWQHATDGTMRIHPPKGMARGTGIAAVNASSDEGAAS